MHLLTNGSICFKLGSVEAQIDPSLPAAIPAMSFIPNPSGNFTGDTLVEDPETGFLVAPEEPKHYGNLRFGNGSGPLSLYTAKKKLQTLLFLMKRWNLSAAARSVGLTRQTLMNHLSIDDVFRECVENIRECFVDDIDEVRFNVASKASGSFDRMCVLNAYRRSTYNPKVQIEVEHTLTGQTDKRDKAIVGAIDAEVIETVSRAKRLKTSSAL